MKKTIITIASITALTCATNAQVIDFSTLTDTNGFTIGAAASGQVFNLANGIQMTATWNDADRWANGGPQAGGAFGVGIDNEMAPAYIGGGTIDGPSITFSFDQAVDVEVGAQLASYVGEYDLLVATGGSGWTFTNNNTDPLSDPTTLTGVGTDTMVVQGGIDFNGGERFPDQATDYKYANSGVTEFGVGYVNNGTTSGAIANSFLVTVTPVPEPSSTALLGLGALGLLVRRKR